MNTIARSLLALAALAATATPAFAGKVKIRNCLDERVFVCAYNGNDSSMILPSDKQGIGPGKRKSVECSTNKCKVFMAISSKKA
ncbi:MAG: hypothetical protein H6742_22375, partial [Alphaproteobacteria bacterium]|nr:hypothetical protein [Alphaproteobacteria bacterium]